MTISRSRVYFHFLTPYRLRDRNRLRDFIIALFRKEGRQLTELSFIFCDDSYLLALNQQFLNHNYYTDILSFPFSLPESKFISGEIYISVQRVRENAKKMGIPFNQEIHRVIFHGILHLCKYKDKTGKEQAIMRKKENQYLDNYL